MTAIREREIYLEPTNLEIPPTALNAEGERHSIFEYYSAENELDFVLHHLNPERNASEQLTQEQLIFYLQENVTKFLGEFAGKIPYTSLSYTLDKDTVRYAGIDILQMLEKTNTLAGPQSREWYENQGLMKAYAAHLGTDQPEADMSIVFSPPKDWNYNFTFLNERQYDPRVGNILKTHAVRRVEQRGTITESARILQRLEPSEQVRAPYTSAEFFLANPLIDPQNIRTVDQGLRAIGLTEKEILYSRLFEQKVVRDLSGLIEEYTHKMLQLAVEEQRGVISPEIKAERIGSLNQIISTAFVMAERIRSTITESMNTGNLDSLENGYMMSNEEMFAYAVDFDPWVIGGGSCPVTTGGDALYMSAADATLGFQNGFSFAGMLDARNNIARDNDAYRQVRGKRVTNCPLCGKSGVVLLAEDINEGVLKCDNPACERNNYPIRAHSMEERLGILCIWDTSREAIVMQPD